MLSPTFRQGAQLRDAVIAIVPLKGGVSAKSRLASVLDSAERTLLVDAMARHVFAKLAQCSSIVAIWTITASPRAAALARSCGARVIRESDRKGTAAACKEALEYLRCEGLATSGQRLLFINGDLPMLETGALDALVASTAAAVVAPDRTLQGTNALLVDACHPIEPCFGERSFDRHLLAARRAAVTPAVFHHPALAFDVDEVADLAALGIWAGRDWARRRLVVSS